MSRRKLFDYLQFADFDSMMEPKGSSSDEEALEKLKHLKISDRSDESQRETTNKRSISVEKGGDWRTRESSGDWLNQKEAYSRRDRTGSDTNFNREAYSRTDRTGSDSRTNAESGNWRNQKRDSRTNTDRTFGETEKAGIQEQMLDRAIGETENTGIQEQILDRAIGETEKALAHIEKITVGETEEGVIIERMMNRADGGTKRFDKNKLQFYNKMLCTYVF
ncbi:hypothetical protein CEXT_665721 [Caerostris extrusa]|uniref:Uncharacterized protein n=1 Tax=Caerostris extrusa TaxID=172846 RepID=A0AAV4XZ39_CAEEX|nr:hypothetical protein CEXT_665721 [Caerostris extrusa]